MAFDTAGEIISDAAIELGLVAAPVTNPFAGTDPLMVLLCQLLKSAGRDLRQAKQWTFLQKEYTLTTVQGQSVYPLPADFGAMINQTGWNRTNRLPLGGPLSPQEWQCLASRLAGIVYTVLFRPLQGQLSLYPSSNTPGGQTIAYEYMSSFWVMPQGQAAPSLDAPTASSDTICFDSQLCVRALKLAFLKAKGFDSTSAQADYDTTLRQAMDDDSAAPVLSLNGRTLIEPMLGAQSYPITGYGS